MLVATLSLAVSALALVHAGGATALASMFSAGQGVDPVTLIGSRADLTGCLQVPLQVGKGSVVVCNRWNGVTAPDGVVEVVSLHAQDTASVVRAWEGEMPKGLQWGDSIADVQQKLGAPARITSVYGTPTFIYMFRGERYGSLELRFSAGDRLDGINACLTR